MNKRDALWLILCLILFIFRYTNPIIEKRVIVKTVNNAFASDVDGLHKAMNWTYFNGGGTVNLADGIYQIDTGIILPKNTNLIGSEITVLMMEGQHE